MPAELLGFDELMNDFSAMAAKLAGDGPSLARALKAGAVPIKDQMIHNASTALNVITGDLIRSIKVGSVKSKKDGAKWITIGAHYGSPGFYSHWVEFGHGGPGPKGERSAKKRANERGTPYRQPRGGAAAPHPFARPAFDARKDEAYEEMKRVLREALDTR